MLATPRGRRWFFAILYATEGAPMGFIWWALPTLLARQGVSVAQTTAITSAATLPWIFKFLMGPVVDASRRRGVRLRSWILLCQAAMVVTLAATAFLAWPEQLALLTACLVLHGVFAATQDVAIDTLAIASLPPEELGRINGWMQAGMLTGRAAVAGGATAMAAFWGPGGPVLLVAGVIALPMLLVALATVEPRPEKGPVPAWREWWAAITTPAALLGVGIALLAGSGFEYLGVVIGPLLESLGADEQQVSRFFALVLPASLALGALAGGRVLDRLEPIAGTVLGILAVAVLAGGLGAALLGGLLPGPNGMLVIGAAIYLGIGLLVTASYTLFMRLSRGGLAATRFALFMSMTNACEAWSGFAGGRLHGLFGHGGALLVLVAVSLLALPLLSRLRRVHASAGTPSGGTGMLS